MHPQHLSVSSRARAAIARYSAAAFITAVSLLLRDAFSPWFGGRSVFVVFVLAVCISAGIGGLGPGILSTLIIAIYGTVYVTRQAAISGPNARPDYAVVVLFVLIGLMISVLGEAWYRSRVRAGRGAEALEHSEQRFRLLIENVVDYAILLLNPEGIITSWNPGAERITGYSEAEILGQHFSVLHPPGDKKEADAAEALREADVSGRLMEEGWRIRRDGSRFWASVVLTPMRDRKGGVAGYAKVMRDLTDQRRAEQVVLTKQAELENVNFRLKRAMMETHHRVKNSLQVISAMVDLRLLDAGHSIPVDDVLRINRCVVTLAQVHALLTSEARDDSDATAFSAKLLLEQLLPLMQSTSAGCVIDYQIQDIRLPSRLATSLALVTNELVSNAMKHCGERITVNLRVANDHVELKVADDGSGFPPDFSVEKFGQTGLELVQNLAVYDFGGELVFSNLPEGGGCAVMDFQRSKLPNLTDLEPVSSGAARHEPP